jgi:hypothetical protein
LNATHLNSAARLRLCLLSCLAWLAGCADGGPPRYPVDGQVLYGGQALAEALVIFHPKRQTPPGQPKPTGITDGEGRFQLTTLQSHDGAPEGDYAITIELRELQQMGEEATRSGRNLLPHRYAKSDTSPLSCTVKRGPNEIALRIEK